jgi:hypothetical protein
MRSTNKTSTTAMVGRTIQTLLAGLGWCGGPVSVGVEMISRTITRDRSESHHALRESRTVDRVWNIPLEGRSLQSRTPSSLMTRIRKNSRTSPVRCSDVSSQHPMFLRNIVDTQVTPSTRTTL